LSKLKIFVAHTNNQDNMTIENEVFTPIHLKIANDIMRGDNINEKYESFCKLTTQYWVWKNVTVDYYGFCSYNNYFSFSQLDLKNQISNTTFKYLDKSSKEKIGVDNIEKINDIINQYDIILPIVEKRSNSISIYDQYNEIPYIKIKDIDLIIKILEEQYPEYVNGAKNYLNGNIGLPCDSFIMESKLFHEYSSWLFSILFEFENRSDMRNYCIEGIKTPLHMSKILLDIFCHHIIANDKNIKIGRLPVAFFEDTSKYEPVPKAYDENAITVAFSSNELYAPFCATAIQSIIDYANNNRNYEIIVLSKDITSNTAKLIEGLSNNQENINIRVINISYAVDSYDLKTKSEETYANLSYISVETYFRLLLPDLLCDHKKVVYLDCDLILREDIAKLFDHNIDNYFLAGVAEVPKAGIINGSRSSVWYMNSEDVRKYYFEQLNMKEENHFKYVNAGVLVLNLEKIRKQYSSDELMKIAQEHNYFLLDQDLINSVFDGGILNIDCRWNTPIMGNRNTWAAYAPKKMYEDYERAQEQPWIIHYCGVAKPWDNPNIWRASEFWSVLKTTPFYEVVLHRMMRRTAYAVERKSKRKEGKEEISLSPSFTTQLMNRFLPSNSKRKRSIKKIADGVFPLHTKRRVIITKILKI